MWCTQYSVSKAPLTVTGVGKISANLAICVSPNKGTNAKPHGCNTLQMYSLHFCLQALKEIDEVGDIAFIKK